jgi:hypothetical protein
MRANVMRPYLAVLKDSFREALASRVLWILLVVITVVLVLVAPVGFKERKATRLQRNSVRNWPSLIAKIQNRAGQEGPSPGRQIFGKLSAPLKKRLAEAAEQSPGELSGDVIEALGEELNGIIDGPVLYDAAVWHDVGLVKEARELVGRAGTLDAAEAARLNRLSIEAAWPSEFHKDDGGETRIVYLGFESEVVPLSQKQLTQFVGVALMLIINYAVGVFGVFAAILVTSSIIPQMFEGGAIDLLLSKPVSRIMLFLTKFAGGCVFIGLIAAYFISGLWLIAGARFGIWNGALFLCIPIMLFLFAIYYGVSALAGVIWRNAIVSVVVTVLFWALCFGVGMLKGFVEPFWINFPRLVKLIPAGKSVLGINETGVVHEWHGRDATWNEVFTGDDGSRNMRSFAVPQPIIGPVYDAKRDRILAAAQSAPPGPGGGFNFFPPAPALLAGNRTGAWNRKKIGTAPLGTLALFASPAGDILAVTRGAVFRLTAKTTGKGKSAATQEEFTRAGPESALLLDPSATVAMNPDSGAIVAFNRGTVLIVEPDAKGKYVRKIDKEVVPAKDSKAALAAFAGQTVLIALADGRILVLDATDLTISQELRPVGENAPRFVAAGPGGRWVSVLFHNRKLWLFDVKNGRPAGNSFGGQGDISAVAFDGPDHLLTIDRGTRMTHYDLDPFQMRDRAAPELKNVEIAFYYVIMPIYTVLPKPGELGNAVAYLLTDLNELQELGRDSPDLSQHREKVEVAEPIWSSLAFLAVILSLASLYVWRTDF